MQGVSLTWISVYHLRNNAQHASSFFLLQLSISIKAKQGNMASVAPVKCANTPMSNRAKSTKRHIATPIKKKSLLLAGLIGKPPKLKTLPAKRNTNKSIKNEVLPVLRDIKTGTKIESLPIKRDTAKLTWTNIKHNVDRLGKIGVHVLKKQKVNILLLM